MNSSLPNGGEQRIAELLRELGVSKDFRISEAFVSEAVGLITDEPELLDLKIASAAVTEMREAFAMFAPYQGVPKVSIFGSARTKPDDPLYEQTVRVARQLADAGWMVVTGAGPGIMEAGMEGAGVEQSIGVSIRLPFEAGANSIIADDDKHVAMKYFFTRKLMLVKESAAFVCLPGGFRNECFRDSKVLRNSELVEQFCDALLAVVRQTGIHDVQTLRVAVAWRGDRPAVHVRGFGCR